MKQRRIKDIHEKFMARYIPEPNSGCWLWTGDITNVGYGILNVRFQRFLAHRYSYEKHVGPIPGDLVIDHKCRVRSCVNPDHLEAVTMRENLLRGIGLSAQNARKTKCIRGHDLAGDNLVLRPTGERQCRECRRMRDRQQAKVEREGRCYYGA